MTNRKISNFEFSTLNYFITRALLIGVTFNMIDTLMKQDCWIIPLLSIIPAILFILCINYIMKYEPSLDLSQKVIKLFKNKIGTFMVILLVIAFYFIALLNYLNLNNFVQSQFLSKTPMLAISIMFAIATYYILSKGIDVVSRTSTVLFYISMILFVLSLIGLIPELKLDNVKPLFTSSTSDYIKSLNGYYAFKVVPMFLLTIIPKDKIENAKVKKALIISYILSAISIFIIVFQTICVFGYELSMLYEYPQFLVLKHVTLAGLSSRVESILVMQLLFDIFILNVFTTYFIGRSVKSVFNIKQSNLIYFIVCVLVVVGTTYISKYNVYLDTLMKNFIPIAISVFSIIFIILICIKIKMSK